MQLFEIYLTPGGDASQLLSEDVLKETGAQVFGEVEAKLVGLEGIPDPLAEGERVFIACAPADERLVQTRLEASDAVAQFKLHQI